MTSKNKNILQNICRPETILAIQHEWKVTLPVRNKCHEKYLVQNVHLNYCNFNPIPSYFEFNKFQILVQTYYSFRYSNQMNFGLQWSEKMYFKNHYIDMEDLYLVSRNAMFLTTPYWTNGKMRKSKSLH